MIFAGDGLVLPHLPQRPGEIHPVEAQDHVRIAEQRFLLSSVRYFTGLGMQRMVGRKRRRGLQVRQHARAEHLRERDALVPCLHAATHAAREQQRALRLDQHLHRGAHRVRRRVQRAEGAKRATSGSGGIAPIFASCSAVSNTM